MNIRWTREALEDYQNILDSAAKRNILEASNISDRVQRIEQNISIFPKTAFHNKALRLLRALCSQYTDHFNLHD